MIGLISKGDSEVLANSGFIKNAVFYKDMLAFYDAYSKLLSLEADEIPNYCKVGKGNLCLEGICLFMKNYQSELGFESVKLTLGYLKVLYYTIASYSDGKNFPDRKIIEQEFRTYKDASKQMADVAEKQIAEADAKYKQSKAEHDDLKRKYASRLVSARIVEGLFVVFLVLGFMSAMVVMSFYFMNKLSILVASLVAAGVFVVLIGISIGLKVLSKKLDRSAGDLAYTLQNKKRVKDTDYAQVVKAKDGLNRIVSERQEFKYNFSKILAEYRKPIKFEKVIKLAKEYRLLSYNVKLDVIALFENHENEVRSMLSDLSKASKFSDMKAMTEIYKKINEYDWFKYNSQLILEFIRNFSAVAEKTFEWKLDINGVKVDPFGIDVKKLAKEQIVYLKSRDDLFVSAPLDKFMNTNLVKNENILTFESKATPEAIRELKSQYISHFFDYDSTKKYNNLFYDKKLSGNAKISSDIIEDNSIIPTFAWLKIKCAECKLGMNNASSATIAQIEKIVEGYEGGTPYVVDKLNVVVADNEDISPFAGALAEDLENFGVKYTYGEATFIGYRLS